MEFFRCDIGFTWLWDAESQAMLIEKEKNNPEYHGFL